MRPRTSRDGRAGPCLLSGFLAILLGFSSAAPLWAGAGSRFKGAGAGNLSRGARPVRDLVLGSNPAGSALNNPGGILVDPRAYGLESLVEVRQPPGLLLDLKEKAGLSENTAARFEAGNSPGETASVQSGQAFGEAGPKAKERGLGPDLGLSPPVAIIGAGPAGLSLAQQLKKRGLNSMILDRGLSVGATWRRMPTHLRLLSTWNLVELPDSPREITPAEELVSAERFARYLQDYARVHGLRMLGGVQVTGLDLGVPGGLRILTRDHGWFGAKAVVNATGYASKPFIPAFPGARDSPIPQFHFAAYKDAVQVADLLGGRDKKVLIVGYRLSASQVMVELHEAGFHVALSARGKVKFLLPSPWQERIEGVLLPIFEPLLIRLGLGGITPPEVPMEGGKPRRLIRSGRVPVLPDIASFDGPEIVFADGRREAFDAVIYATGFRPALDHLPVTVDAKTGLPALRGFESEEIPGLFFLGLSGHPSFRSRFLRGIREDAKTLAQILSRHFG